MQDKNKEEKDEKLIENSNKKDTEPDSIPLSRGYRIFLAIIMLSVEGMMNVSSGTLSSASKNIKRTLKMNDKQFGTFGTSNSIGRIIGSTIYTYYNQKFSRKWLIIFFLAIKALFLIGFKLTNNGLILIVLRGFIGLAHMPFTIYVACWIDQYSISFLRNVEMSAIQVVQPGGKLVGFLLHILCGEENWQMCFVIEGLYLLFCCACMLISPEYYFSRKLFPSGKIDEEKRVTIYDDGKNKEKKEAKKDEKEGNYTMMGDLKLLSKNGVFMLAIVARCVLFGLNTGFHFWVADYMRNVVNEKNSYFVFLSYTVICIAGPMGGILTNVVLKPWIGGYETRKASWPLVILHLLACIFGVGISFMRSRIPFIISTTGYFVFNASALPLLQGILICSAGKRLANTGFAIANIFTQVLTQGPAPVMYGAINDKFKDRYPGLAMFCLMFENVVALPFLVVMAIKRNRQFDEIEKKKKELEDENAQELDEEK